MSTPRPVEECTAARIAAAALRRELKKLDTWATAGAVAAPVRAAVVELLRELERRARPELDMEESKPLKQKRLGFSTDE